MIRSTPVAAALFALCLTLGACQTLSRLGHHSQSTLVDTYWRLTQVAGYDVPVTADAREPYLLLTQNANAVEGFGGCNNLEGRYRPTKQSLTFSVRAETSLFCGGQMGLERGFINALNHARAERIDADRLTLFGAGGRPLARFRARLME